MRKVEMEPDQLAISRLIWRVKYRGGSGENRDAETSLEETFARVTDTVCRAEQFGSPWSVRLLDAFCSLKLLPGGRILANCVRERATTELGTLINTFVMPGLTGDTGQLLDTLFTSCRTLHAGGGIGLDFSRIPPSQGKNGDGPVGAMSLWDAVAQVVFSRTNRRAAMMAVLSCEHPDILKFIDAKSAVGSLPNFNVSVLITEAFMSALQHGQDWPLQYGGSSVGSVSANDLWVRLVAAAHAGGEPGVIFIDRIAAMNNLSYCERISATNSCAEQPLPEFGAVPLASVNLAGLVRRPFSSEAKIDTSELEELVSLGMRLLDNVIDISSYPDPRQRVESSSKRRVGLGVTGLADALILCGRKYGDAESLKLVRSWFECIRNAAYHSSVALSKERGAFPFFERESYLSSPFVGALPRGIKNEIAQFGTRNGVMLSIAPAGSISLLAGNVSSGIEPVFAHSQHRVIKDADGKDIELELRSHSYAKFCTERRSELSLPEFFATAQDVTPEQHLAVLREAQTCVDGSVSKTINCSTEADESEFSRILWSAHSSGCKSVALYRPSGLRPPILKVGGASLQ